MMKYNFVYKTTNDLNGYYYYGVHSTNDLNDGYIGSGLILKRAINKYGIDNFTREIVQYFSDVKYAFRLEAAIVTPELVADPHCYNIAVGGNGGYTTCGYTDEQRKEYYNKIKEAQRNSEKFKSRDLQWSVEQRKRHSIKMSGQNNPMYGKNCEDYMTQEAIKIKREKVSGMNSSSKRPEVREKMSNSKKGKKTNCSTKGLKWINDGTCEKYVHQQELQKYIDNGWETGRLKN